MKTVKNTAKNVISFNILPVLSSERASQEEEEKNLKLEELSSFNRKG